MDAANVLEQLDEGDRVLYSAKRDPLTVVAVKDDEVTVKGPKGGMYVLFRAPDDPELVLESKSGNREYASRVENLRIVGAWEQIGDDTWKHTMTGATVEIRQNDIEYWSVTIKGFKGELPDIPKYGFVNKKYAQELVDAFLTKNPEG